ncbi:FecCD family ABC transporter permease [Austwickia chelonae]|uniref:FecCD family ABC transporter permease n=1 Tax=Austwickia chelonae TaxID=100225 RepID=UPI000E22C121|nr:iron ABC transporter permease [Austwickia chelonae]
MTRRLPGVVALIGGLLLATCLSLAIGARTVPPGQILDTLLAGPGQRSDIAVVVWELRVPRTAIAVAVGAALGLAGALVQGHTRNPLADPGILGVTAGASFFVVLGAFLFRVTDPQAQVWFAFVGAAVGTAAVFAVCAAGNNSVNPLTLVLAGAALSAFLTALTSAMALTDDTSLNIRRFWAAGSVAARDLDALSHVLPYLVVGAVLALATGPTLTVLALGDDSARALGVPITLVRWAGFLTIALLTGAATAVAGPISFLGLVVPHMARAVTGPDYRWLLPCSALLGSIIILLADTAGRIIAIPGEVEVGIVTALLGAPVFIALVRRRSLVHL